MKVQEFIEVATNNKNKMLKGEQLHQLLVKTLEVKDYLGIKEKRNLIDEIINECIIYEDGVLKFDDINKYICFTMKTIAAYTSLELSGDMEEDYDALCRAKLLNSVVDTFSGEYDNVKLLLQMQCEYILSGNSVEAQFSKFLNGVLEKIDDVIKVLDHAVNKFDISKLPIKQEDFNKILAFVNSYKK